MQPSPASRKRAAPGASPMVQQQQSPQMPSYTNPYLPDNPDYSNFDFNQAFTPDQTFSDPSISIDPNNFAFLQNTTQANAYPNSTIAPAPSTELVRRSRNQQLAPSNGGQAQEQWTDGGRMNGQNDDEDEQELDRRVQQAKREAQGKRKQIPPFVQKLSSFLDSSHTDLIRWSDDGRSFIVLDEDEFARTLIPELFKHNNYASFVRQLNMYGFHKTVNITDGSLRQSEKARKGVKPPSMYSHPYFRKNRPDLLWLIQKPNSKAGTKRKRDGNVKEGFDSDDERQMSPAPGLAAPGEIGATNTSQDLATLPRSELAAVRQELQKLQNQQRFISKMITELKNQNEQFYRQATAFQALHDRHENSINAILTFLATFYNRSLQGQDAQNLVNMFGSMQNQQQQQHGSVVEEFNDGTPDVNNQMQRFFKKQPLLLPGPVSTLQQPSPGSAHTEPNSARTSVTPPEDVSKRTSTSSARPDSARRGTASTASPVVKNDAATPNLLNTVPENDQMMSLINSVNATNASTPNTTAPAFDFTTALDHYQTANGNAPLTPQQRDDMLALMATQQDASSNTNNAMISSQAPTMPDLNQFKETQQQLEMLTNMQRQQDEKVQELNRRLQPLSPTGTIPGLANGSGDENPFDLTGAPGDYDPNAFINFDDSTWDPPAGGTADDLNFDFGTNTAGNGAADIDWDFGAGGDHGADMFQSGPSVGDGSGRYGALAVQGRGVDEGGGGRVESVSSEATSPANTVVLEEVPGTPKKRQRRS